MDIRGSQYNEPKDDWIASHYPNGLHADGRESRTDRGSNDLLRSMHHVCELSRTPSSLVS